MSVLENILNTLEDKKCEDTVTIETKERNPFTDYVIIGSVNNERQLEAVAQALEDLFLRKENMEIKREGKPESGWIVVDAENFLVHILTKEKREEFKLEEIA
ncbi:MAG TPA: ribosome silencing factor [Firmicutes bacterium]|nr:ribosome silencing factor [Bacillota bacterium]HBN00882.1 ribosome silencing factor [Bacillota bacterium]